MREITPKLWIGNALEARDLRAVLNLGIEAIVDLAIEEPPVSPTRELIYHRVPLSDGQGNLPSRIRLAVNTVVELVASGTPTVVACSAGMSRSPSIVAAALSQVSKITLDEALQQAASAGPSDVSPALLADIAAVLEDL